MVIKYIEKENISTFPTIISNIIVSNNKEGLDSLPVLYMIWANEELGICPNEKHCDDPCKTSIGNKVYDVEKD